MLFSSHKYQYPDDIFDDSRMSFGDHIEELRTRMIRALLGLVFCLLIGFVLDWGCDQAGYPELGIGRPVMRMIVDPVESQTRDFYRIRALKAFTRLPTERTDPAEAKRILEKLEAADNRVGALTADEKAKLRGVPREMPIFLDVKSLKPVFGEPKDPTVTEIEVKTLVYPAYMSAYATEGESLLESRRYLTTLSAQEAFMVYFKVSLLCGVVLSCPWLFYQAWAFVAAGLYPHERAYVHKYLPFSVGLFLAGVLLCQFVVLPGAVKALLGFNTWIDSDPDLRLNEWLSFAIVLPLVFGVSFQTPLVMFFLSRIGLFTWETYWKRWRAAVMVLAVFAAVITPTPDAVTMMYLFVPMFGLYMLGVLLCKYFPGTHYEEAEAEPEVAV